MRVKLFTHDDLDGYGCSLLAKVAFDANVDVDYCGYNNINEKVKELLNDSNYKEYDLLYITDISVSEEVAELLNDKSSIINVKLIDHHNTALKLNKYSWCTVIEEDDTEKVSGTSLFYKYLLSEKLIEESKELNLLVEKIKRYDTWLWQKYNDKDAKDLNTLFYLYGKDRFLNLYLKRIKEAEFNLFSNSDKLFLEIEQERIDKYIGDKNKEIIAEKLKIGDKEYYFGVVLAESYISELGNKLSELNPHFDFIAIINSLNKISYRTTKDNINLATDVSSYFGGGGHPKAAGSQISSQIKAEILKSIFYKCV